MDKQESYCVKCRKKTEMAEVEALKMKNGRPALKGKCAVCGTGVYKILPVLETPPPTLEHG